MNIVSARGGKYFLTANFDLRELMTIKRARRGTSFIFKIQNGRFRLKIQIVQTGPPKRTADQIRQQRVPRMPLIGIAETAQLKKSLIFSMRKSLSKKKSQMFERIDKRPPL